MSTARRHSLWRSIFGRGPAATVAVAAGVDTGRPLRAPGPRPVASDARYLVIVARDRPERVAFWQQQFADEPKVEVIVDRREGERRRRGDDRPDDRRRADRRQVPRWDEDLRIHSVVLVPARTPRPSPVVARKEATDVDAAQAGEHDRIHRWAEEGRDLVGRVIPGLLDQVDRERQRAEAVAVECETLRQQVGLLRLEIKWLLGEIERSRAERQEVVEAINQHMTEVTRPFENLLKKLRVD